MVKIQAIGEATQQPPHRATIPWMNQTLLDVFNEAMKEPPRDVREDFSKYGTVQQREEILRGRRAMRDQGGQGGSEATLKTKKTQLETTQANAAPTILRRIQKPKSEKTLGEENLGNTSIKDKKKENLLKEGAAGGPEDKRVESAEFLLPSIQIEGIKDNSVLLIGEHPILQVQQKDNERSFQQNTQMSNINSPVGKSIQTQKAIPNNNKGT